MHSKKLIHRDLKSLNILLDESTTAYVCDFGTSRLVSGNRELTGHVGTLSWMPPEIFAGEVKKKKNSFHFFPTSQTLPFFKKDLYRKSRCLQLWIK